MFESNAQTRLLEYLLEHRGRVFTQAALARLLSVSSSTIARVVQPFVEEDIVAFEQVSGQMKIIALNDESEKTKALIDFYEKIKRV